MIAVFGSESLIEISDFELKNGEKFKIDLTAVLLGLPVMTGVFEKLFLYARVMLPWSDLEVISFYSHPRYARRVVS